MAQVPGPLTLGFAAVYKFSASQGLIIRVEKALSAADARMIVDCHTHVWESPQQLGKGWGPGLFVRHRCLAPIDPSKGDLDASAQRHRVASEPVDRSFVLGFKSRYLGSEIPTDFVAAYVRQQPDRLIGFAGIDPTNRSEAMEDLHQAREEPGIKGITVSPAAQDFHPANSGAMEVFAEAARLSMPVILHDGVLNSSATKLEFARPVLLDEVARDLPDLKLIVAHMGYPWIEECIVLLGRHANVYADISALIHRPWQAYNALLTACQYGVMHKLLFGSDFPYNSAALAIESLYRLNQIVTGTNLPTIPRQQLAAIVERDALSVLNIQSQAPRPGPDAHRVLEPNEA